MAYYPPKPEKPEEKQPEPVSRKKIRPLRDRILVCFFALIALYGVIRLAGYGADLLASGRTRDMLKEAAEATDLPAAEETAPETAAPTEVPTEIPTAVPTAAPTPEAQAQAEPEPTPELLPVIEYPAGTEISNRFRKLRKQSKYIVGWITMNNLDEPVVQKDNKYFLTRDAMGKKNSNGAIFLDGDTSLKTRPYTLLVYGHNMKSGAMFGDLRKYKDYAYCARHRVFSFETMYEPGMYAVFSVAVIGTEPASPRYIDFRCLMTDNREIRKKELEKLERLDESGATVLEVDEEDQLLLLITCTGNDTERLVVCARRLRDGEKEDSLHFRKY